MFARTPACVRIDFIAETDRTDPQVCVRSTIGKSPESVCFHPVDPGEAGAESFFSVGVEPASGLDPFEQQPRLLSAHHSQDFRNRQCVR